MLISTDSMQTALCVSMKPIPPMSAARLKTSRASVRRAVAGGLVLQIGDLVLDTRDDLVPARRAA